MTTLTVCIFSFNRGQFLRNCVASCRECLPEADIVIFDDNSDDPETLDYLDAVKDRCQVIKPSEIGTIKHGGLYHNMNGALDRFSDRPLVCFLQDDTQLVRPVSSTELEEIQGLFDRNQSLGFVHPCFIRGIDLRKRPVTPLTGPAPDFFYREDTGQSAGIHYSDLVLFQPARLKEAGWRFHQSEPANDKQAREHFAQMAYMWRPFAMWLPEVPAYRGKKKTLGLRLAERKRQVGFYPFRLLTESEISRMQRQAPPRLPVAEECLKCLPGSPPGPWTYNPLTGQRWLKHLNNLEVVLRRWLKL
ncbi:MAG: glycosyltransferase [Oleiphilaceae bacterium]|nr:glycosyltransferase [Oleiphilaceae bacterium]